MLPLDVFLPRLMPKTPGCPEPTALQALLDAATDFCDRTRALRLTTDPTPLVEGQALYDLDLPTGTEPLMIVRAWVGARPLGVPPEANRLTVESSTDLAGSALGTPEVLLPYEGATMRVYRAPDAANAGLPLYVRLALRPTPNATQIMDSLFTRWRDAIVGGAVSRLCSTLNQAYSNPAQAAEGQLTFTSGVSRARMEANRDMSPQPLRAYNAPFA